MTNVKDAKIGRLRVHEPFLTGREIECIGAALDGGHLRGDGPFTGKCEQLLESALGCDRALLTSSGTHALEMIALLLDLQPGDEVIIPSFTFVSTANAFVLRGVRPVFVDIDVLTLGLEPRLIEQAITPRTRAIVAMHYAGLPCAMEEIVQIARRRAIPLVEDNAHGLFGRYHDRALGTFGRLSALSFHESKNFTSGEGGSLVINHPEYTERALVIREKGTDRLRFLRGDVPKYRWMDVGSSYLQSDILAALLFAQLQQRDHIQSCRARIWELYSTHLADWAAAHGVALPQVPPDCVPAYHLYYLLLPTSRCRDELQAHLDARQISTTFHFLPLHLSPMGQQFGGRPGDCPVAESAGERLLRIPFYTGMSDDQVFRVIDALKAFRGDSVGT